MTSPSPAGPSERASWRRTLRAVFLERLGLKFIAIFIAVLLWLIVKARQPVQDYVPAIVLPTLDSSLVLLETPPRLRALVSGRAVDIVKLHVDPPVLHRIIDGDVPDTLVLDVTPADVRVPADLADQVRVLDVEPRSVTLRFGTRATRRVPVVNDGRVVVKDGGVPKPAEHVEFDPRTVRITGPRRLVRRLNAVHPYALMIDSGDTLQHIADLDTSALGVRVLPSQVKVMLRYPGKAATQP
jgi:YbbR domain-containing protein